MTREEVNQLGLEGINHKAIILELPTGYGKTAQAINIANKICDNNFNLYGNEISILIVVAKSVHKENWLKEIDKWGGLKTDKVIIECYESLKKYKNAYFDVCILDEVHHMTESRLEVLESMHIQDNIIGLSATIPDSLKQWFTNNYDTKIISVSLQEAINEDVLPEPTIYLWPLELKSGVPTELIVKNPKAKTSIECCWAMRWSYIKQKIIKVYINCTEKQYLQDLDGQIEWFKKKSLRSQIFKNKWLRLCGERLKWLSEKKEDYVLSLLDHFKNYRTITFCNNIEQTERLGKHCIHSKNKNANEILNDFNNKKIKHITSCQMLNEGVNITDCRIGIYANINSSEIINIQRQGRLLRHKKPVIVIPYFRGTREHEIVKDIIKDYNKDLIKVINNLNEIDL